jgi:hypothetical protein
MEMSRHCSNAREKSHAGHATTIYQEGEMRRAALCIRSIRSVGNDYKLAVKIAEARAREFRLLLASSCRAPQVLPCWPTSALRWPLIER